MSFIKLSHLCITKLLRMTINQNYDKVKLEVFLSQIWKYFKTIIGLNHGNEYNLKKIQFYENICYPL